MDAPNPSLDFLGADVVELAEEAEFRREVPAPRRAGRAADDEVRVRGAAGEAVAGGGLVTLLAAELADGLRPMIGGVEMRGVPGLEDFGVEGLDHESKKSSSVSSFAGTVVGASIPST